MTKRLVNEEQMNISGGNFRIYRSRTGKLRVRANSRLDTAFLRTFLITNGYYNGAERLNNYNSVLMTDGAFNDFYNQCLADGRRMVVNFGMNNAIDDDTTEEVL